MNPYNPMGYSTTPVIGQPMMGQPMMQPMMLDFHNYCRVIMHWNLPGNPIDLEQREGRINRFKCLAIRQNVSDE